MKIKIYFFFIFLIIIACQPYRLTRIGYDNLRKMSDTLCDMKIIDPGAGIPNGDKIGRIILEPRIGSRNWSKADALLIAKIDACAVNANTLYIVQEKPSSENPRNSYACIVDLYRETRKSEVVPDFIRRAQAEAKSAKEQRDKMDELKPIISDTDTTELINNVINIDSIPTTTLRRYAVSDSLTACKVDSVVPSNIVGKHDTVPKTVYATEPKVVKEKLRKGVFATVGHHYGGATIAGLELEAAVWRIGLSCGGGVYGYSGAVNFHIKPDPLSSYFSCLYWKNGFGDYYKQSVVGTAFNYRGKRWLSMQLGVGKILEHGIEFNNFNNDFLIIYSLGAFVPF